MPIPRPRGASSERTHAPALFYRRHTAVNEPGQRVLRERQGVTDRRTVLSSVRLDRAGRPIVGSISALEEAAPKSTRTGRNGLFESSFRRSATLISITHGTARSAGPQGIGASMGTV